MKKDVENTTILDEKDQEIEELRLSNSRLKDRVKWLERALFSSRSERIVSSNGDQLEFDDLLAELAELNQELESQEKPASPVENKLSKKRKKRRSLDELIPEDLPRQDITLDVPEVERTCPDTGEAFKKIGEEISEKVAYKPGSYFVKRYIRPKYVHPSDSSYGVLCEPMIDSAIAGSSFDESFTAGVAVDKCAYHLPLYRQQEKMKNAGLDISRQTLSQHYIRGAEALKPLFTLMKERIVDSRYIFTDDTPVQLQMKGKGKTATGRMWVYIAGGESPPYQVFDFTIDRKKEHPINFLGDFQGYIHADAYSGYNELFKKDDVTECACWMHVRRKFFEAEDGSVEFRARVLQLIRNLYRYERVLNKADAQTRLKIRQEKVVPIIDEIFKKAQAEVLDPNSKILPRSKIRQAITYLLNQEEALKTFLNDGHLKPDNGASERAIRPLAIGRKNWLFAGSKNGGQATGIWLSLIQTCRSMDIDPFAYLDDALCNINSTSDLEELLPDRWKAARQNSED